MTPSSHVTGGDPGVTAPQPAPGTHHRSRDGSRAASRARPALHRAPRSPYGPPSAAAAQRTGRTASEGGARVAPWNEHRAPPDFGAERRPSVQNARSCPVRRDIVSLLAILGRGHQGSGVSRFRTTDTGARDSEHRTVVVPGNNEVLWNTIGIREAHGWSTQSKVIGARDVRQSPKFLRSHGLSRHCFGKPCSFGAGPCL